MDRAAVIDLIGMILKKQGKPVSDIKEKFTLKELGFRSLDFSELCLRVEESIGRELDFDGALLRGLKTVEDVCDFLTRAQGSPGGNLRVAAGKK